MTIRLKGRVAVAGEFVRLGEIAELSGLEAGALERWRSLVVIRAPLLNGERSLSQAEIRSALKRYGIVPEALSLSGPERISVRREGQVIARAEIQEAVADLLRAQLPWSPEQIQALEVSVSEETISLPQGELRYQVGGLRAPVRSGTLSLPVTLQVNGEPRRRIWVKARIQATQPVVVTRVALERGRIIGPGDLVLEERPAEGIPQDALADPEEALGKQVKRALEANAIVRVGLVERPILVRRGAPVVILVETPHLKITALGEALQHGAQGDRIRVLNRASKKEVLARVVDGHTAQVDF